MMIAQDSKGRLLEVTEYGKSMYGGWYANFREVNTSNISGIGARTLQEICNELHVSKTALRRDVVRYDNI